MKLTRRQLSRLIKENLGYDLLSEEVTKRMGKPLDVETTYDYEGGELNIQIKTRFDNKSFLIDIKNLHLKGVSKPTLDSMLGGEDNVIKGKDIVINQILRNTKRYGMMGSPGSSASMAANGIGRDPSRIAIEIDTKGVLYGENEYAFVIELKERSSGQFNFGKAVPRQNQLGDQSAVVIADSLTVKEVKFDEPGTFKGESKLKVKTFEPKIPWAQSAAYQDDVRFFQLFILFNIDKNAGGSIRDPEFVMEKLGSAYAKKKFPHGFDGRWGGITTDTWEYMIENKMPNSLAYDVYKILNPSATKQNMPALLDVSEELKDYKKVLKKIPVDKFLEMVVDPSTKRLVGTTQSLKDLVGYAAEFNIAIPKSFLKYATR